MPGERGKADSNGRSSDGDLLEDPFDVKTTSGTRTGGSSASKSRAVSDSGCASGANAERLPPTGSPATAYNGRRSLTCRLGGAHRPAPARRRRACRSSRRRSSCGESLRSRGLSNRTAWRTRTSRRSGCAGMASPCASESTGEYGYAVLFDGLARRGLCAIGETTGTALGFYLGRCRVLILPYMP